MTALASRLLAEVRGAVARGWCAPANSTKVMDTDLAEAIAQEVCALMQAEAAAALSGREAVAWLCSHPTPYGGRPFPGDIQLADVDTEDGWTERPLIYGDTTPPAPVDVRVDQRDRWHLASLNDGLFIINEKPSPSGTDIPPDWGTMHPSVVLNVTELPATKAQEIVEAHNALLDGQPAGVDDVARLDWVLSQVGVDDRGVFFTRKDHLDAKKSRAEIDRHIAALGGGVRS